MPTQKEIDFSKNLIQGKIAETVFEQMIRNEEKYTIIPFGYEHTVPTLTQYKHILDVPAVIDNISEAPDFALISEDKTKIYLVEVKYRKNLDFSEIKNRAEKLLKHWEFSWIFVATPDNFYCMPCNTFKNSTYMHKLSDKWITKERQEEYLKLLKEFEK